ncbi:hypothetical protein [Candidatus Avelusimicrobium facis]|uniref:hypothetical protein n=1 Tax=Candidatus Avelusimicrobium facis TaxID=3416203 RepID=UPI0015B74BEA|nr:MAG TPA: head to tail adaptor [Caudoviricetes sp.]
MTALKILQEMARLLGLDLPQTLTNNADQSSQRLLGLLNRALDSAVKAYAWQNLQQQVIFRADTQSDAYNPKTGGLRLAALAPDFSLAVTPQLYELGSSLGVFYLPPAQFTQLLVQGSGAADKYFSVLGGELLFLPKLTADGWKCLMRYASHCAVRGDNATAKRYFDQDSDTTLLDEELLILGGVYKFKQEMGYDYADAQADYEHCLSALRARDGYAPVLRGMDPDLPSPRLHLPETGAGGAQ